MELHKNVMQQIKQQMIYQQKSQNMMGNNNHNFGKKFSEETKRKMSIGIRSAKKGVSDEIIREVRNLLALGKRNVDIQESLNLPRHTVTRIKNKTLLCRDEE